MSSITVRRVQTEHGSHIEPPFQQSWSNYQKLRWHAAVVAVDAGIAAPRVEFSDYSVRHFGIWYRQRGYYDIAGCGPLTFNDAWGYLNGMLAGAKLARGEG